MISFETGMHSLAPHRKEMLLTIAQDTILDGTPKISSASVHRISSPSPEITLWEMRLVRQYQPTICKMVRSSSAARPSADIHIKRRQPTSLGGSRIRAMGSTMPIQSSWMVAQLSMGLWRCWRFISRISQNMGMSGRRQYFEWLPSYPAFQIEFTATEPGAVAIIMDCCVVRCGRFYSITLRVSIIIHPHSRFRQSCNLHTVRLYISRDTHRNHSLVSPTDRALDVSCEQGIVVLKEHGRAF